MHMLRSGPLVNVILQIQYPMIKTVVREVTVATGVMVRMRSVCMNEGLESAIKNPRSSGFGQFTLAIALDLCYLIRVY